MSEEISRRLLRIAREVAQRSYSPHSQFEVGCALLCTDGTVIAACNVENRQIGLTICAERSAIAKAVSEGQREFQAMAVVALRITHCWPCGNCRQTVSEFAPAIPVLVEGTDGEIVCRGLDELLPETPEQVR